MSLPLAGPGGNTYASSISLAISGFLGSNSGLTTAFTAPSMGIGGSTYASGINNSGSIVGFTSSPGSSFQSYRLQSGIYTPISAVGGTNPCANAINNEGDVVGSFFSGNTQGFLLPASGSFTPISPPGSLYSVATDINNVGQIVGWYVTTTGVLSYLYEVSGGSFATISLGPPTYALGINDSGQIVGVVDGVNSGSMGFLRTSSGTVGTFISGEIFTVATGINNSGVIVGYDEYAGQGTTAFTCTSNGAIPPVFTITWLSFPNTISIFPETTYLTPQAINDSGQIVGNIALA